jgi:N utilization substance protein B
MLTRRQIRVKVMQCIYALIHAKDESLENQEKFLEESIANMYALYLLILSLMVEVHAYEKDQQTRSKNSYLSKTSDQYPDKEKFINNSLLVQLATNELLKNELSKRKLKHWYLNDEYVKLIHKALIESKAFDDYMKSATNSFEEDKQLVQLFFKDIIAPNEKIYDYFEDDKLTWVDDFPIVNTFLLKLLKKAKKDGKPSYFLPRLLKDKEDMKFAKQLLSKTLLNNGEWEKEIEGKTPNWDKDRIADIDMILLKMAICELLNFSSIPEKVTINEFLEIAKEYSTPKSSIFINGILDKLVREYKAEGKLKKAGRGLL